MKEKDKDGFIVPYGMNFGSPILGETVNNFTGFPLFLVEEPVEELEEL